MKLKFDRTWKTLNPIVLESGIGKMMYQAYGLIGLSFDRMLTVFLLKGEVTGGKHGCKSAEGGLLRFLLGFIKPLLAWLYDCFTCQTSYIRLGRIGAK